MLHLGQLENLPNASNTYHPTQFGICGWNDIRRFKYRTPTEQANVWEIRSYPQSGSGEYKSIPSPELYNWHVDDNL